MTNNTQDKIYQVQGRGGFPIDMLRYDRSCPFSENDSGLIESDRREERTITLIRLSAPLEWKPGIVRWSSFLWTVKVKGV